jgi:hypothetical protein
VFSTEEHYKDTMGDLGAATGSTGAEPPSVALVIGVALPQLHATPELPDMRTCGRRRSVQSNMFLSRSGRDVACRDGWLRKDHASAADEFTPGSH